MMHIKQSEMHNYAFGLIFIVLAFFSNFYISGILSTITFALYIYCSVVVWKKNIFLKYIHLTFSFSFLTVGLLVCEYGNLWLGEIGRTTYYNGALSTMLLYFWLLVNVIIRVDRLWDKKTQRKGLRISFGKGLSSNVIVRNAPWIVFVFNTLLFLSVVRTPFFLVGTENRFEYSTAYLSRMINVLKILPSLFNALLIIPIIRESKNETIPFKSLFKRLLLPNIPYLLFMIWTGNKFGSYWELICMVLIPCFSLLNLRKINIKKLIRTSIIGLMILIGILYLFYYLKGLDASDIFLEIYRRIACQGELWWSAFDKVKEDGPNIRIFTEEISFIADSIKTEGASRTYGVFHLMDLFGVPTVVERYLLSNIRYSACGFELPYLSLGMFAFLIIPFIYGNLYSLTLNMYTNSVKEGRVIGCVAAGRIFQVTLSVLSQGDWYSYTSLIPMLCITVLIFTYLVPTRGKTDITLAYIKDEQMNE